MPKFKVLSNLVRAAIKTTTASTTTTSDTTFKSLVSHFESITPPKPETSSKSKKQPETKPQSPPSPAVKSSPGALGLEDFYSGTCFFVLLKKKDIFCYKWFFLMSSFVWFRNNPDRKRLGKDGKSHRKDYKWYTALIKNWVLFVYFYCISKKLGALFNVICHLELILLKFRCKRTAGCY